MLSVIMFCFQQSIPILICLTSTQYFINYTKMMPNAHFERGEMWRIIYILSVEINAVQDTFKK